MGTEKEKTSEKLNLRGKGVAGVWGARGRADAGREAEEGERLGFGNLLLGFRQRRFEKQRTRRDPLPMSARDRASQLDSRPAADSGPSVSFGLGMTGVCTQRRAQRRK